MKYRDSNNKNNYSVNSNLNKNRDNINNKKNKPPDRLPIIRTIHIEDISSIMETINFAVLFLSNKTPILSSNGINKRQTELPIKLSG